MTISEKVAYLKGLADGLELDKASKEGRLIDQIIHVLEDVAVSVEDLEEEVEVLGDGLDALSEDVEDLEALVYDDFDDADEDEEDLLPLLPELGDDFFEIECPSCGEDIVIDESVLDVGEVSCPNCGDRFSLDLTDEDPEDD